MKLYLYYIGKHRDPNANSMAEEYMRRVSRYAPSEMRELRPERTDLWTRHPKAHTIFLDSAGRQMSSREFTSLIERAEMASRDLVFLVGGAAGLPTGYGERADQLLSLSRMTYPHEMARAILAEQIYRALATLRGHPYAR